MTSGGWHDAITRVRGGGCESDDRKGFVRWVEDLMQKKSEKRYAMIKVRPGCAYGLCSDITLNRQDMRISLNTQN